MEYFLRYTSDAPIKYRLHDVVSCDVDGDMQLLESFYSWIGCNDIEIVRSQQLCQIVPDDLLMVVDGSFLLHNDQPDLNPIGTHLYGQMILGSIVIGRKGSRDGEPDIVGFDSEQDAEFVAYHVRNWIREHTPLGYYL